MRLYHKSIASRLMYDICWFGNLPYSALRLYSYDYESTKDAVQKLVRAGYIGIVKARNIKSLYATPQGFSALNEACKRWGGEEPERYPIIYNPAKAARVDKLNETILFFTIAGFEHTEEYIDSRDFKRDMEEETPRSADSLKYSRFAGLWHTEGLGMMVYHFGRKNIHLNQNGELSAKFRLLESMGKSLTSILPMLILGDNMDTMLAILRYSEWWYKKSRGQRKHLKNVHFYLDTDSNEMMDYTYFLPVNRCSIPILRMMHSSKWEKKMYSLYHSFREIHGQHFVWALGCHLKYLMLHHICHESERGEKITIICYDWQQDAIERYFREILDYKEVHLNVCNTKDVEDFFWERTDKLPYKSFKLERGN